MSIGSIGAVGSPDDQAVDNWDPGAATLTHYGAQAGTYTGPVIPCARYSNLYIFHKQTTVQTSLTVFWYTDSTLARAVGGVQFQWDPTIQNGVKLNPTCLGPYFQLTTVPSGGGNWTDQTMLFLNNRNIPFVVLQPGVVIQSQGQTLTAGQSIAQILSYIGLGAQAFYINGGTQGVNVLLECLDVTFTWVRFCNWSVAATVDDYRVIQCPVLPIRFTLTNISGAASCTGIRYSIMSTVTGAS